MHRALVREIVFFVEIFVSCNNSRVAKLPLN